MCLPHSLTPNKAVRPLECLTVRDLEVKTQEFQKAKALLKPSPEINKYMTTVVCVCCAYMEVWYVCVWHVQMHVSGVLVS